VVNPRPRLLFLCKTLPYPPDSGLAIRSFHVLRLLAGAFEVTALCFAQRKRGAVSRDGIADRVAALRELADVEAYPVPQEHSASRLLWDHVRSTGLNRAYTWFAYDSRAVADRIRLLLASRRFSLIHVDSIVLSRYLALFQGIPVICVHHNVESELLRRRGQSENRPLRRAYFRHQASLLAREERRWGARCDLNIAVSEPDRLTLERLVPGIRCAVVPNGVDVDAFRPRPGHRERGLVFVGESTWAPNRDALQYFCEAILPRIRADHGATPVRWVGHASETMRREYRSRHGVELTGYMPDVRPHVQEAACYVVPLRVGGGTRLKILDAWAMGKAVVSTSIGCEGLAAEDGRNILIRDDPGGFASAVCTVLQDDSLRRRLGREGRRTVEQQYSWDRIGESMLPLYEGLLPAPVSVPASFR
jgi:glycosyltransferase involved in cell wall biosynthesis